MQRPEIEASASLPCAIFRVPSGLGSVRMTHHFRHDRRLACRNALLRELLGKGPALRPPNVFRHSENSVVPVSRSKLTQTSWQMADLEQPVYAILSRSSFLNSRHVLLD